MSGFEEKVSLLQKVVVRRIQRECGKYGWIDDNGIRQGGLVAFVREFWHVLEPQTPFVDGWVLWAMIEHLEAVTAGKITRLMMNVPPGSMKSLLVDVFWPAWEWGPMGLSHMRYVAFSYSASLTMRDNERFRRLITSPEYKRVWSQIDLEKIGETKITNAATGWKLATSVGGVGTGERGNRVILDDPHNVKEQESEAVREETIRWFRESMSNRLNDLERDAIVLIMQRVHEGDVSGVILDEGLDYVHLCIPMEYDPARHCTTGIGWTDPRDQEGEPAWPARFPPHVLDRTKKEVGKWAWASQYAQSPAPRGGGIFERGWWKLWDAPDRKFPPCDFVVASLDAAYTEKEENDPSALTVWGVFNDPGTDQYGGKSVGQSYVWGGINGQEQITVEGLHPVRRRFMLLHAWRKFLKFEGTLMPRHPAEPIAQYRARCLRHQNEWGLVEWVAHTCRTFKIDLLLIEAKASGISAAQSLQARHSLEGWGIQLIPAKGDKVARAMAAVPAWSQGLIYAPDKDWAQMVIDEMASFPKAKYDDLCDSAVHAINFLRAMGYADGDEVEIAGEFSRVRGGGKMQALYPC